MSQQVSQTVQEQIDELVQRTWEKEEERKKKKALLVSETTSTSQECPSKSDKGQETTTTMSAARCTITIECINKRDESTETKTMGDESEWEKEIDVEEQEVDVKKCGKTTDEPEDESTDDNEPEDEPSVVELENPVYKLSETYEMESEYESMTIEQEAAEVWALSPTEQAKYRELTRLHQRQADIEKRMTGVSKMIKERTKLLIDLIKRSVQVEPAERQELHRMMEKQRTWTQIKQDEIPQTDRPGTGRGYYLFVKDDAGCMIEQ